MECKCFFEKIQKILYSSNFGEQSGRKESGAGGMGVRRAAAKLCENLGAPKLWRTGQTQGFPPGV